MLSSNNQRQPDYTQNVIKTGGATLGSFPCTKSPKDAFINMDTKERLPQRGSVCCVSNSFTRPSVACLPKQTLNRLTVTSWCFFLVSTLYCQLGIFFNKIKTFLRLSDPFMCPLLAIGKLHYTAPFDPSITNDVFFNILWIFLVHGGFQQ